jgi:hypothetical protein
MTAEVDAVRFSIYLTAAFLLGAAAFANAQDVAPTRAELFDRANGADPAPPANTPPTLKEVRHEVTITGAITPGLRLDLELQYLSTNRFKDVIVGGVGWVKEPEPKMLRPGVTYKPDGTYEIKFSTFQKSWLGARYALHYARIGILKAGAGPTWFDLRADAPAAPGMLDCSKITVKKIDSALSADLVTSSGSAPHRVLQLPPNDGWTSYTIDVTQE